MLDVQEIDEDALTDKNIHGALCQRNRIHISQIARQDFRRAYACKLPFGQGPQVVVELDPDEAMTRQSGGETAERVAIAASDVCDEKLLAGSAGLASARDRFDEPENCLAFLRSRDLIRHGAAGRDAVLGSSLIIMTGYDRVVVGSRSHTCFPRSGNRFIRRTMRQPGVPAALQT